jgi:hypothetical protein
MKSILDFFKKNSLILAVSSFISLTIGFFGPSHISLTNQSEFSYAYTDIIFLLLAVTLILLLFFLLLLFLIQKIKLKAVRENFLVLIFSIGFLFWVQGSFLVHNFGLFDGKLIDWSKMGKYMQIDNIVWISVLFLFLLFSSRLVKKIKNISYFLILFQLIYLVYTGVTYKSVFWFNKFEVNEKNEFTFSKKKNVIIILVDTFQASIFQEILSGYPGYADFFDGFTFYRNSVGGFPFTQPSVPLILTGTPYDNSVPFLTFIKDKYTNHSIPKVLKNNNFISEVYPMISNSVYLDKDIVDNLMQKNLLSSYKKVLTELATIFDLTLFRYTPQPIKNFVYNNQKWRLRSIASNYSRTGGVAISSKINRDVILTQRMLKEGSVDYEDNVFKFFHFNGVHSPLTLNENLKPEAMSENRLNYKRQSIAILKLLKSFLDKLKALQIYDNSLIFIVGDHGFGPIGINNPENNEVISDPNFYQRDLFQGAALPLMLVKPFNSKGKLITSKVPVATSDIPKTIFSELGIDNKFQGESILKLSESAVRERFFHLYSWKWLNKNEYLPDMTEYKIQGDSWLGDSWSLSYKTYLPEKIEYKPPQTYTFGKITQFGKKTDGTQYKVLGWSSDYNGFIWSINNYASIHLPITKTTRDIKVEIDMKPFIKPGAVDKQDVEIYINGVLASNLTLSNNDYEIFSFSVPISSLNQENVLKLSFKFLNPIRPIDLGISSDNRILGIYLKSIQVTEL